MSPQVKLRLELDYDVGRCRRTSTPPQPHGLEPEHARVAADRQFGSGLGEHVLLEEGEREGIVHIYEMPEAVKAGNLLKVNLLCFLSGGT